MASSAAIKEWRQHWPVAVASSVALACGLGSWPYVMSSFVEPLQDAFGWTRGEIASTHVTTIMGALVSPIFGVLTDRFGVRPVLLTGMVLMGLTYVGFAHMSSLPEYFVLYTMLKVLGIATTGLTVTRAVSSWFSTARGTALSVSRFGTTAVGAFLPAVLFVVMERYGWQGGFYTLAAMALFVGGPLSYFWVRDRRERPPTPSSSAVGVKKPSWLSVVGDRRVVIMSLAGALSSAPIVGILSQLQPILTDAGVDPGTAANLRGLFALATFLGIVATGILADLYRATLVASVFTLAAIPGSLLLGGSNALIAGTAITLLGIAQGAMVNLIPFLTARYFGIKTYSTIYGVAVMAMAMGSTVGGVLFGFAHDWFASYAQALVTAALCFAGSAFAYLLMGPYPEEPAVAKSEPVAPEPQRA